MVELIKTKVGLECFSDDRLGNLGDLIRFCMTDKVIKSINSVVEGDITPIDYANILIDHNYELLYHTFFASRLETCDLNVKHITTEDGYNILTSFMFDKLVLAGAMLRLAQFRYMSTESIANPIHEDNSIFSSTLIHLLTIYEEYKDYTHISGLTDFKAICTLFVGTVAIVRENTPVGLFMRLSDNIEDVDNLNCILRDKLWGDILLNDPERCRDFRRFLYISLISMVFPDELLKSTFNTTSTKLLKDVNYFIDLREDKETTREDVLYFLDKISIHLESYSDNMIFYSMCELPYSVFEDIYTKTNKVEEESSKPRKINNPLEAVSEDIYNTLGELYNPIDVVANDFTPLDYTNSFLGDYRDSLLTNVIESHYNRMELPKSEYDKSSVLMDGVIRDYLMMALVYERYKYLEYKKPFLEIKKSCHILLVGEDEGLGLSVLTWVLPYHRNNQVENFTTDQITAIDNLLDLLQDIGISFPSLMNEHWKEVFEDLEVRTNIRSYFFTLIESFYIDDEETYKKFIGTTKDLLFTGLKEFNRLLSEEATKEELLDFLSKVPSINNTISVTDKDYAMWLEPFEQQKE
jgi:hypothetical protein